MNGFVIVPRVILENEAICKDAEHIGLYVYLLSKACFKEGGYIVWKGEKRALEVGELVTSMRKIEKDTKIPKTKVSRILEVLKKWDMIGTATDGTRTLISIGSLTTFKIGDGTKVGQEWDTFKENKDEKEKSSKREKEENKEIIKKEIPPISPKGDEKFNRFWQAYPKKVGKRYAKQCFFKLNVDNTLLEKMLETLAWQKNSRDWQRENGKYIPNPSTWLNQGRWDDEDINENRFREQKFGVYL